MKAEKEILFNEQEAVLLIEKPQVNVKPCRHATKSFINVTGNLDIFQIFNQRNLVCSIFALNLKLGLV